MSARRLTTTARREKPAADVATVQPRSTAEVSRGPSDTRLEPSGIPSPAPSRDARPSTVALRLDRLKPERIGALLGRPPVYPRLKAFLGKRITPKVKAFLGKLTTPRLKAFLDKRITPKVKAFTGVRIVPKTRFLLIGLASVAIIFFLAYIDGGLTNPAGTPTAIKLIFHPVSTPVQVSLPLLQDPVGLIAIVVTLLTPILFAQQVHAIGVFNETNERNIDYRSTSLNDRGINDAVRLANKWFDLIGRPRVSLAVLAVSAALSFGVNYLFFRWGLFYNWNNTDLTSATWKSRVYAGWWANHDSHLILAIALWALGCYFFYFIIKQVYMGAVFAVYIQRIEKLDFGVSPNMRANTDGFWGLSEMRGFMLATYSSSISHTVMVIGILIIWLPFNVFTLLMIALVTIINAVEVIYPTRVGHVGAVQEKKNFVKHVLGGSQRPSKAQATEVEAIWDRPLLPFRVRSTLTTVTISLLFPLALAVASRLISG